MRPAPALLILLTFLLLGLLAWRGSGSAPPARPTTEELQPPSALEALGGDPASAPVDGQDARDGFTRKEVATTGLRGRVSSSTGAPLDPEATVRWTSARWVPDGVALPPAWPTATGREATTVEGRFDFPGEVDPGPSDVLIAVHPDHTPAIRGDLQTLTPIGLELEPSPALAALVVTEDGGPAPGATVELRGLIPVPGGRGRHLLIWEFRSDPDGLAVLFPLAGPLRIVARGPDGAVSPQWHGTLADADGEVRLVLRETFACRGRLLEAPGTELDGFVVSLRGPNGRWDEPLAQTSVRPDGTFECDPIPWVGSGEYTVRLQGPGLCTLEQSVSVDHAGATVEVDFTFRTGIAATFQVVDSSGAPVPGVRVMPYCLDEGRWVFAGSRLTDDAGEIRFEDLMPGYFGARTSAAGFVDRAYGPWDVPKDALAPFVLTLQEAGRLTGRVTYEGEPVETFEIRLWNSTKTKIGKSFQDRDDGSFAMDRVPRGEVRIVAQTDEHPPCAPQVIEVPGTGAVHVELELDDGRLINGRVLDVASGLPIANAEIQCWSTAGRERTLGTWGPPGSTGLDGRYTALRIPSKNVMLAVQAEGYEEVILWDPEPSPAQGSVGTVGLAKLQTLEVQLLAPPDTDFAGYQIRADRERVGQLVSVNGDGQALIEGIDPGSCRVNVFPPGGGRVETDVDLVSGQKWTVAIPVGSTRTVVVEVRPARGHTLPEVLWVNGVFPSPTGGVVSSYVRPDQGGEAEFACAAGGRAVFEVLDELGNRLATRSFALPQDKVARLPIVVAPRTVPVRLVTGDGNPIVDTLVSTWITGDPMEGFRFHQRSDSQGEVRFGDFGTGRLSLVASSTAFQSREHVVDLTTWSEGDGPIVVTIRADSSVLLKLLFEDQPAPGVRAGLRPPGLTNANQYQTSGPSGELRFPFLEQGTFEVNIRGAGLWPTSFEAAASPDPAPRIVYVRRRGSVKFEVRQGGLPVPKARITLTSLTAGDDLDEWLAADLISVEPTDLRTNQGGELRVIGLPSGDYSWSAVASDGVATVGGKLTVRGAQEERVQATFP
jgi:hypothetical protein